MNAHEAFRVSTDWLDFVISGTPADIDHLFDRIDRTLPSDWRRNTQAEARYTILRGSLSRSRCYTRSLAAGYEVWLWLQRVTESRVQGGLVEPGKPDRYSEDAAETILDFRTRILDPAVQACGLRITQKKIGEISRVPGSVVEKFWAFTDASNRKWPPTAETSRLWQEFVIYAYKSRAGLDPDEFRTWLQSEGWNEADSSTIVDRFYADMDFLSQFEEAEQTV